MKFLGSPPSKTCLTPKLHRRISSIKSDAVVGELVMASDSLRDLGLDRLSIEERLQLADAIWVSVVHEVEKSPLPDWQRAKLERHLADSVANPDAVRP